MQTLVLWPTQADYHPDSAQEEAAKDVLHQAFEDDDVGDIDCDSYAKPRVLGAAPDASARYVVNVHGASRVLDDMELGTFGRAMGCACQQALAVDDE